MSELSGFFLDIPTQSRSFVPSNCVRPSGAGDFAHNTTKMRGGGISQQRPVRLDAAQLTSQQ